MPAGRNQISYIGVGPTQSIPQKIDGTTITYDKTQVRGSAMVDKAVGPAVGEDTVKLVADGERVFGKLIEVRADGFCSVEYEGFVDLPQGAGAACVKGKPVVGAVDGSGNPGFVRLANSAVAAELTLSSDNKVWSVAGTPTIIVEL